MKSPRTLFICLDGAEFSIFDRAVADGRMPRFARLCQRGVRGHLNSVVPNESCAFWATAFTGFLPDRTGIFGRHLVDDDGMRRATWQDCQVPLLWEQFASAGLSVNRVAMPLSHPASAQHGVCLSDGYPGEFSTGGRWGALSERVFSTSRAPDEELKLRLRELRYQPEEVTFDWVRQFIPEIAKIDQARDRRPAALGTALARTLSIHNAATLLIEDHPADLEMIRYPFWSDLCRTFLPYLDPRPETIEPMECDLYRNVLPAACQLFDQMLDRLLQLCGDETLICMVSDHGFRLEPNLRGRKGSGSLAFKPCLDPRSFFLMSSSKLAANTQVQSPTTADIAPTLLAAAGIPLAYGSDGRPWVEAFEQSLPFEVRSEGELGLPSRLSGQAESSTAKQDVAENLKYLKAQGYVDPLEVSNRLAAERLEFDQGLIRFSLLVYRERTEEAAALAHLLCQRRPCAIGLRLQFIQDLFYLGCIEDAGTLAEEAYDLLSALSHEKQKRAEPSIAAEARLALLSGLIAWKNGRMEEAVRYLDEAGEHPAPTALTHLLRGEAYLKIGEVARALKAFELAEKIEPLAQEASLGQARCLIKFRRFDEALDPLLSVVEVRPNSPLPQFLMGLVLDEMGQTQTAVVTLQRCLQLSPSFDSARQLLDRIEAR